MNERVELGSQVLEELRPHPALQDASISVTAREGVVTLTGYVRSYEASCLAGRAAKRVPGVHCVINELALGPAEAAGPTLAEGRAMVAGCARGTC